MSTATPQRLENTILHIELGHPVLIHKSRKNSEGSAGLSNNGDGNGGTDTVLTLLNLQVVKKSD
jgi:hypothetical protein